MACSSGASKGTRFCVSRTAGVEYASLSKLLTVQFLASVEKEQVVEGDLTVTPSNMTDWKDRL